MGGVGWCFVCVREGWCGSIEPLYDYSKSQLPGQIDDTAKNWIRNCSLFKGCSNSLC